MKAILFTFSLLAMTSNHLYAGNGENFIDRLMHRKISYPESLRSKGIEASVSVQIRVIGENQIEIVQIDSASNDLKDAVTKQIQQIHFVIPKSMIGQVYQYVYKFEIQE